MGRYMGVRDRARFCEKIPHQSEMVKNGPT